MILDIIIVVLLLISAYMGYTHGFIHSLLSFLGKIIAAFIAYFYHEAFKDILVKFTGIDNFILEKVKRSLSALGGHAAQNTVTGSDVEALSKMQMPDVIKQKLTESLTEVGKSLGRSAALSISNLIMNIISIFLLFIIIVLIIVAINKAFSLLASLPVLNFFNKAGGVLLSLLSTYIILTVIFLLLGSFMSISDGALYEFIEPSIIANFLIKYNPLLILLAHAKF